uniref:5-oxoprolinase n=1 Tax=Biomphalaria glabrata TaxID=6526 RepID=A0A2C9JMB0_BIOGL
MDGFGKFQFAIDRGGTFTDIWAKCPNGKVRLMKLLSEDPANYDDAPKEAIRRIIHQETQTLPSKDSQIDTRLIDWIRMGTTVATNALLERKGERMALLITKGFRDLLHIGNQSRPNIFDLEIVCPENLYEEVIEVEERVVLHQMDCELDKHGDLVQGSTGEKHYVTNITGTFYSYMKRIPACADAYLTPCIKKYVNGFSSGLQKIESNLSVNSFMGSHAILSGPAGGVVGYAETTFDRDTKVPVIGFDMGGTSTDVSRFAGEFEHVFETTTAGITIQAPQLDINTVAAGGGSMLFFRSGMFVVGPESAGAHPGPVCYMKGGPLTITDANLCLGRLLPEYFPRIFGKTEDMPLDKAATLKAFEDLTHEGQGVVASYNSLSPRYAGILSAYGMALADVVYEAQEPAALIYASENFQKLDERIASLEKKCFEELEGQGFQREQIETHPYLHLRYEGTDCALMCPNHYPATANTSSYGDFSMAFVNRYQTEFGFTLRSRNILVDNIRVRGVGKSLAATYDLIQEARDPPQHEQVVHCYFEEGCLNTSVFLLDNLLAGHEIKGPAIIIDKNSTILVEPNCTAAINKHGNVNIKVESLKKRVVGTDLDAIQLSIFSHRFMSTAEQMGRALQRTSISTNIKERLDFSCAMFGPDGGLVANAPHIPVHLGAMQETVQYQIKTLGDNFKDGDVILSNHPEAGGSHLPDLTVITPVFFNGQSKPVFFVASRGHHADIGGITPGSMPPHSTSIFQEGAVFKSFKLVENGEFKEQELIKALQDPAKYPGSKGSRNLQDNISDLKAQVAANHKGIKLITELITEYGLEVVQAYMKYIQENAEVAVKEMLKEIGRKTKAATGRTEIYAEDFMDHGSRICLHIKIDENEGTALFDFTGTGHQVYGNTNAPRAITLSAIIYCMRCMVGHDVPLNQNFRVSDSGVSHVSMDSTSTMPDILYPVIVQCFKLNPGSGGRGLYNGGDGVIRELLFRRPVTLSLLTERRVFSPYGLEGGNGMTAGRIQCLEHRNDSSEVMQNEQLTKPAGRIQCLEHRNDSSEFMQNEQLTKPAGRIQCLEHRNDSSEVMQNEQLTKPAGRIQCLEHRNDSSEDVFHLETPGGGGYGKRKLDSEQTDQTPSKYNKKEIHGPHLLQSGSLLSYKLLQESA